MISVDLGLIIPGRHTERGDYREDKKGTAGLSVLSKKKKKKQIAKNSNTVLLLCLFKE